ncbi:uncharacterized protein LOC132175667 [Corylus avellana]|uniref:uncharacterized protein LOC132175667 n=1 Tax=Corylus avellana TaxID=13451 RepID=UPI001E1F4B25|nr:uncharacterized protein LOC132175667 [Corylus avellana]XP_059443670.1 uncharacterized protein LOC132175667 [Corylus avellana]
MLRFIRSSVPNQRNPIIHEIVSSIKSSCRSQKGLLHFIPQSSTNHEVPCHQPAGLLGPPELYNNAPETRPEKTGETFMNLMVSNYNKITEMFRTENGSPTYLSSGDPCLDFFFHVVPDTRPDSLTQRLELAWAHNPLTTLKLICNLRGVRGTGKSDKFGFYTAALWLHMNHPKTLVHNIESLAKFGYFKDLPEILYLLLESPDIRIKQKKEWRRKKYDEPTLVGKDIASAARKEKRVAMAKKALERYKSDKEFQILHDSVSDLFAKFLKADVELLNSGNFYDISLAAKWCPSLDCSFDKSILLCESIARRVFPVDSHPEYRGIEDAHYAYRVRDRLRKEVLVPIRKSLELPEVYMSANRWNEIPYNRIPSVAMNLYREKFLKHDEERFVKYLEDVKVGKSTIAAGALLPHEIIASVKNGDASFQVADLQWKRMVEDLSKEGKLRNCLAVCDVSGSMYGTPWEVSVAMGLLVSDLSEEPWKGKVIIFSKSPQLHIIEGDDLQSKMKFAENTINFLNTDFQKVFDLILQVAVDGKLKEDQMIKRIFAFSDMEFDNASCNDWETDYKAIQRKFRERGYGSVVPEIVFWNLRDSKSTPVTISDKGVALVSGFSKNLMKLFFDGDGIINPADIMEAAISGEEYQKLAVVD